MRFVPVSVDEVVNVDRSDAFRRFGPAYRVTGDDQSEVGAVWRETTVDAKERVIKTWWWAKRAGSRVKVLRESSTRSAAAALLRGAAE